MNIHEYQQGTAEALRRGGAQGYVAWTPDEAVEAARKLPGPVYVVKSQLHAGGRVRPLRRRPDGKGGVRLARSLDRCAPTPKRCWATP